MAKFKRTHGVNCDNPQIIRDLEESERVAIRTINKRPIWHLFRDYINSLEDDQEFNREQLLHAIYVKKAAKLMRSLETSVDSYRMYVCALGYVDHIGTGKYIKRYSIPENATLNMIKKYAYNDSKSWKKWFVPNSERRASIKTLCDMRK